MTPLVFISSFSDRTLSPWSSCPQLTLAETCFTSLGHHLSSSSGRVFSLTFQVTEEAGCFIFQLLSPSKFTQLFPIKEPPSFARLALGGTCVYSLNTPLCVWVLPPVHAVLCLELSRAPCPPLTPCRPSSDCPVKLCLHITLMPSSL